MYKILMPMVCAALLYSGCASSNAQPASKSKAAITEAPLQESANNINPQLIEEDPDHPSDNLIQVAILLDVSSSMDGLINQAKSELWGVVNEIAKARKNGKEANLQIALYDYGKSSHAQDNGYIEKILDFTNDLDLVSEKLFSLNTNGGDEYCGAVIKKSVDELHWLNKNNYDVIFIAGNEPFNQGKVSYKTSCYTAKQKNIFVNTIHCGEEGIGITQHWKDGATIGGGEYFYINANTVEKYIPSPYDEQIQNLNNTLNSTYWGYGAKGKEYKSNQMAQDVNNESLSKNAMIDRAASKVSSSTYEKASAKWDATSRAKEDKDYLVKATDDELPEQLQNKTVEQKKKIINDNSTKRDSIAAELKRLSALRELYLIEARKLQSSTEKSLGTAMAEAIHKQAGLKGFVWSK
jgi:hypothetical protein